ncbi:putative tocopherol O-methyltransferase [Massariosphaeria phaeospora]|uniref:Sterol 24-C-methyltransferase n=1 Tax=Massariosphaeria phaeospora TaxID=100035 RepID=A0A7C8HZD9_9PLEO|nr:putative tocopherol O-methyltransferase [Massariosphaeria phaeospora]
MLPAVVKLAWRATSSLSTSKCTHEATLCLRLTGSSFYDSYTDFALEGWGQSFHFCRYSRGREPMSYAIARHEHYIAYKLGLEEGMTVLDVGCGVGGPAKEIAAFVGCKVVALNLNEYQLMHGRKLAQKEGVGEDVNLPFPDNTFDAIYAIEATVHAPSLEAVYAEIARVLKPGGRFAVSEWVMTDVFDESVPAHTAIRNGIERGNGIASLRTAAVAQAAFEKSFNVHLIEDLALRKDPLPWWYVCSGDTQFAKTWGDWGRVFRMTAAGRVMLDVVVRGLEFTTVARKGSARMVRELVKGGDCIGEGGRKGVFTPMFLMIGEKADGKLHA